MNVIAAIIAGVVGSAAMIVAILIGPTLLGMSRLDVTAFVGTAFTPDERRAIAIGWLILTFNGSEPGHHLRPAVGGWHRQRHLAIKADLCCRASKPYRSACCL